MIANVEESNDLRRTLLGSDQSETQFTLRNRQQFMQRNANTFLNDLKGFGGRTV